MSITNAGLTVNVVKPASATPASKLPVVVVSIITFCDVYWWLIQKAVDLWWSVTARRNVYISIS